MILKDTLQRPFRDLRISVTDQCNFRCIYCMPKGTFGPDYSFLKITEQLTFDEIERITRVFVLHGCRKIRLTGGEPLLRKDLPVLIRRLKQIPGLEISMTTNGSLLAQHAQALRDAGLDRVTISLDALDGKIFQTLNGVNYPLERVLESIEVAREARLIPIKINMVVKKGVNESEIIPMAHYFRNSDTILRYIEYMDVGQTNGWRLDDVIPAAEIIRRVGAEFPIEPLEPNYHGEVASRYRYTDGSGEIGIIASVTQAFCQDCTRARLSADGKLFTCLFASDGLDLRSMLRTQADDQVLSDAIREIWMARLDRYSELRSEVTRDLSKVEMSYIGG